MKSLVVSLFVLLIVCANAGPIVFTATLSNQLSDTLLLSGYTIEHGKVESPPPTSISGMSDGIWKCTDYLAGVAGTASYKIGTSGYTMVVTWDLPEVGSNEYSTYITPIGSTNYSASYSGGSGYTAQVLYILAPK